VIIFIGDAPGNKNVDPDVAFVGTKSYCKLLEWIAKMNLSINDVYICNSKDLGEYHGSNLEDSAFCNFYIKTKALHSRTESHYIDIFPSLDSIVVLGNNAEKVVKKTGLPYFKLPHPSGRNFKLNDKKYVNNILKECKEYIYETGSKD
jgi:uracil-DNA glycosylase